MQILKILKPRNVLFDLMRNSLRNLLRNSLRNLLCNLLHFSPAGERPFLRKIEKRRVVIKNFKFTAGT